MANKLSYEYQGWVINPESGLFEHNCEGRGFWIWSDKNLKMYKDCYKNSYKCKACKEKCPQPVLDRLYQVWRSWNWRNQKKYYTPFYISSMSEHLVRTGTTSFGPR